MDKEILARANDWVNNASLSAVLRQEIQDLIDENNQTELSDRFYKDLEFGTGGIRGMVGAGINRLNIFNIRKVTQGLSNYIKSLKFENPAVVIGFDCRLSSVEFAKESAKVLAANGILVHFFDNTHATPLISFAVRRLKATAGIVITASHNPPEYNGYKVLWSDGCQVTAPNDQGIIDRIALITGNNDILLKDWEKALQENRIVMIPAEIDEQYYKAVLDLPLNAPNPKFKKGILYTPLHGVGYVMVDELFTRRGFLNYRTVKSQQIPDGNFPTIKSPNPEDETSMAEAIKISQPNDHVILANDPDADRLGVMVKDNEKWVRLNGNQIGQVLLYYWLNLLKECDKLPNNGFVVSTIVTSDLGAKIARSFNVNWYETLTGFKNIGRVIDQRLAKGENFIFAYEESHGYQFGDYIREKDGISAALMFAELFRDSDSNSKSVLDLLNEIYETYGYHADKLINKVIPGQFGAAKINEIMIQLRKSPLKELGGQRVVEFKDYQELKSVNFSTNEETALPADFRSNVLSFQLANGTRVTARPSGTEPKIKFYFNFAGDDVKSFIADCCDDFLAKIEKI